MASIWCSEDLLNIYFLIYYVMCSLVQSFAIWLLENVLTCSLTSHISGYMQTATEYAVCLDNSRILLSLKRSCFVQIRLASLILEYCERWGLSDYLGFVFYQKACFVYTCFSVKYAFYLASCMITYHGSVHLEHAVG